MTRRTSFLILLSLGVTVFCLLWVATEKGYGILYNNGESLAKGFYGHKPRSSPLEKGDYVMYQLPQEAYDFVLARGYISDDTTYLLKTVGAVAGDEVCITADNRLTINDKVITTVVTEDSKKQAMPVHYGCYHLEEGTLFTLSTYIPNSFDSRYHGPIPLENITLEAFALLTW